ncbi:hypothetical protein HOE22_12790 [Candidatus Woesearchaeota archaeon]|jgi:hypothetical protein|nr:hypothetical protein [Candidatus Woesearchaeota archaeon]MBT7557644.1 hypothetical protein [Candidatus Woesearchaeota archaeon]
MENIYLVEPSFLYEDILQHNADNLVKFTDKEYSKLESAIRNGWSKI